MKSVSGFWSLLSLWQLDGRVVLGMSSGNELCWVRGVGGFLLSLLYQDHYHVKVCQCFELFTPLYVKSQMLITDFFAEEQRC